PLVRLNRVTQGIRTPVYAKAEFFNPGGSVKDRIGVAMIEAAEREGRLKPGGLIVEATSGNTGVGLALAAAVKGYRCIFTMPDEMSQEKARLLRALGADVIITPTAVPPDHPENYIMKGRAIAAAHPNAIFADQHYNPVNPEVHYRTNGPVNCNSRIFTKPVKMSVENARLLRALGSDVISTSTAVPPYHPENYIMKGRAIAAAHPNAIFADQHYNPVNPEVHYRTTGPEIWQQTAGKITHFVCAPGTGGTVSGAGRFLKERNPKVR